MKLDSQLMHPHGMLTRWVKKQLAFSLRFTPKQITKAFRRVQERTRNNQTRI